MRSIKWRCFWWPWVTPNPPNHPSFGIFSGLFPARHDAKRGRTETLNPNFDFWPWLSVQLVLWSWSIVSCEISRSKVTRFKRLEWKTDGQTDGRRRLHYLPTPVLRGRFFANDYLTSQAARLRSPVLTTNSLVNGNPPFSTPTLHRIDVRSPIDKKIVTDDYVNNFNCCSKFGGNLSIGSFWANEWNISNF